MYVCKYIEKDWKKWPLIKEDLLVEGRRRDSITSLRKGRLLFPMSMILFKSLALPIHLWSGRGHLPQRLRSMDLVGLLVTEQRQFLLMCLKSMKHTYWDLSKSQPEIGHPHFAANAEKMQIRFKVGLNCHCKGGRTNMNGFEMTPVRKQPS